MTENLTRLFQEEEAVVVEKTGRFLDTEITVPVIAQSTSAQTEISETPPQSNDGDRPLHKIVEREYRTVQRRFASFQR